MYYTYYAKFAKAYHPHKLYGIGQWFVDGKLTNTNS